MHFPFLHGPLVCCVAWAAPQPLRDASQSIVIYVLFQKSFAIAGLHPGVPLLRFHNELQGICSETNSDIRVFGAS